MVERMIGRRSGTGGSPGVEYLDSTTRMRVFTDLWEVRTHLEGRFTGSPVGQMPTVSTSISRREDPRRWE